MQFYFAVIILILLFLFFSKLEIIYDQLLILYLIILWIIYLCVNLNIFNILYNIEYENGIFRFVYIFSIIIIIQSSYIGFILLFV